MSDILIHPTALIDPAAELAADVRVGAFTIIEAGVKVAAGCEIGPMVHIQGQTEIGAGTRIETGARIGFPPQHLAYNYEPRLLVIGERCWIRENVTIHRAYLEGGATRLGDECFLMGNAHVAHDCELGNKVVMAQGAVLGGHAIIGDQVFISGNVAIHQFSRVGRMAMVAGLARVTQDLPPFIMAEGHPARLRGFNAVGLRRNGVSMEARRELKQLLRQLYNSTTTLSDMLSRLEPQTPEGREFVEFYRKSERGVAGYTLAGRMGSAQQSDDAS